MDAKEKAWQIGKEKMLANDLFSQWLGIEILEMDEGYSKVQMTVRDEMTNGFKIAHGGISYSLADSAFAFASNSLGRHAVSIETAISHTAKVVAGDVLTAVAQEENRSHKIAQFAVLVTNQNDQKIGLFRGTVYRSSTEWLSET